MSVSLIAISFILMALVFFCRPRNGLGESILKAALGITLAVFVVTDLFSRLNFIAFTPLVIFWAAFNTILMAILFLVIRHGNGSRRLRLKTSRLKSTIKITPMTAFYATLLTIVLLLTLFSATMQYPYDNDSVCYHMTRVARWIDQGNVEFFQTTNQRQNFYAPGASYLVLHVQLLSGGDKLSVFPHYLGAVLSVVLVGMLVTALGGKRNGVWFSMLVAATIPILISLSHTNQNDLIFSAWLLGFAWFLLRLGRRPSWSLAVWIGIAFGCALMTKGTAFVYCAAIGPTVAMVAILKRHLPTRQRFLVLGQLVTAVIIGLAIETPFILRCNYHGKTFLYNQFTSELRNERIGVDIFAANVLRNSVAHLALNNPKWNAPIEDWVHERVGEQKGNLESTFRKLPFQLRPGPECFYSTNPFHLVLVALTMVSVLFLSRAPRWPLAAYAIATIFAGAGYNLLLKYQYWGIRLQLPWLLLTLPLAGLLFNPSRMPKRFGVLLQIVIALGLFLGALPALLFDRQMPICQTTRPSLIFRDAMSIRTGATQAKVNETNEFVKVAEYLRPFKLAEVGLMVPKGNSCQDYFWWVAFDKHGKPNKPSFRYVGPNVWPTSDEPPPEWIIARRTRLPKNTFREVRYKVVFASGASRVYQRTAPKEKTVKPRKRMGGRRN